MTYVFAKESSLSSLRLTHTQREISLEINVIFIQCTYFSLRSLPFGQWTFRNEEYKVKPLFPCSFFSLPCFGMVQVSKRTQLFTLSESNQPQASR